MMYLEKIAILQHVKDLLIAVSSEICAEKVTILSVQQLSVSIFTNNLSIIVGDI